MASLATQLSLGFFSKWNELVLIKEKGEPLKHVKHDGLVEPEWLRIVSMYVDMYGMFNYVDMYGIFNYYTHSILYPCMLYIPTFGWF